MKIKAFFILLILSITGGFIFGQSANFLEQKMEKAFYAQKSQSPLILMVQPVKKTKEENPEIEIIAKSVLSTKIKKEEKSGEILFAKSPDELLPIASLSKLMTAWVVFEYSEKYQFEQEFEISERAIKQEGNFGLFANQKAAVKDLLVSMLVESSNDSAFALAEALLIPESESFIKEFVGLMNIEAKKLGMKNTFFENPTGLDPDDPEHPVNYSTAKDLTRLATAILANHPEIFEISKNLSASIFNGYTSVNKNILLIGDESILGGKTGWTPMAGGCILLLQKDLTGNFSVNIILGAESVESRFEEMKKLLDWIGERKNS